MTEWKEYTGSDEQIKEIREATTKVLIRLDGGSCKEISGIHLEFYVERLKEYLICNPHPRRDMAKQQFDTGQEVYVKIKLTKKNTIPAGIMRAGDMVLSVVSGYCVVRTNRPDWYLDAEFRFTPFEG